MGRFILDDEILEIPGINTHDELIEYFKIVKNSKDNLKDYAKYLFPEYRWARFHYDLMRKLEAVAEGKIKRLAVFMPRRHGKSTWCSQIFPSWYLGKNPSHEIAICGYNLDLALLHSRRSKDLFAKSGPVFGDAVPLNIKSQSTQRWSSSEGGVVNAIGVEGGIVGFGAHLGIIDDPYKGREQADSALTRARVLDWYQSSFYPCLSPDGAVILIMTRWHPEDLAHFVMENEDEHWETVAYQAIDQTGKALWPGRYPLEKLHQIKRQIGNFEWAAQYQQEPFIRGGNYLDVGAIVHHKESRDLPEGLRWVRFWDLASTEKEISKNDPDYTVGALVGVRRVRDLHEVWVRDVVYGQWAAPQRNRIIRQTAAKDGPSIPQVVEAVAGYKDSYLTLKHVLLGSYIVDSVTVSTDKVTRMNPVAPIIEAGNFHIFDRKWTSFVESQLGQFPNAAHDDAADAISGAFSYLAPGRALFNEGSLSRLRSHAEAAKQSSRDHRICSACVRPSDGVFLLDAALVDGKIVLMGERHKPGSFCDIASEIEKGDAGHVVMSSTQEAKKNFIFDEYLTLGLEFEYGWEVEQGRGAFDSMLRDSQIEIDEKKCHRTMNALMVFRREATSEVSEAERDRHGDYRFAGDGAFVRALFELCAEAREVFRKELSSKPDPPKPEREIDMWSDSIKKHNQPKTTSLILGLDGKEIEYGMEGL